MLNYERIYQINRLKWGFSDDVLQDAILKYIEMQNTINRPAYFNDVTIEQMIWGICNNLKKVEYNRTRRFQELNSIILNTYQDNSADNHERYVLNWIRLHQVFGFIETNLSVTHRIIFNTYICSRMTQQEIATYMGKSRNYINSKIQDSFRLLSSNFGNDIKKLCRQFRKSFVKDE